MRFCVRLFTGGARQSMQRIPDGARTGAIFLLLNLERSGMDSKQMGRQLCELRRRRKQSLRALSRSTGVAVSFLSAVEQGRNNVSVAKLKTILDALGVGLSEFFSHNTKQPKVVYRRGELTEIGVRGTGISYREVAAGRHGRALQLTVERYKPGAQTGPGMLQYDAEEVGVVLKGRLELTVDSEAHQLGPGDAYYFDNNRPHRFRNIGRGVLLTISVNTPSRF